MTSFAFLESGDRLLLESGDELLLEDAVVELALGAAAGQSSAAVALTAPAKLTLTAAGLSSATAALTTPGPAFLVLGAAGLSSAAATLTIPGAPNVPFEVLVIDRPALNLHFTITTPSGRKARWGSDEPVPENVPSGISFSSTMPGGYERLALTLPRRPSVTYRDLEALSTIQVRGASGEVAGEYRLERSPRQSSTERSISVDAVGWQAHLEDDKTAQMVYVDADLSHWRAPTRQREIDVLDATTIRVDGPEAREGANPSLRLDNVGAATGGNRIRAEAYYDAPPGVTIDRLYYDYEVEATASAANHSLAFGVADNDDSTGSAETTGDLFGSATGSGYFTPTNDHRYGFIFWRTEADLTNTNQSRVVHVRDLRVYGTGATLASGTPAGVYASDVIAHAVRRWAPLLAFTTGTTGTIEATNFAIPHLVFQEPTTAAEIIRAANAFHLYDWAVWNGPTFWYHPRGANARRWRARTRPAQLEETGPAVDRIYNGVIVFYTNAAGDQKTAGPPGSDADDEDDRLADDDTENPATRRGVRRWAMFDMGVTSTSSGAIQVGERFLAESKLLDQSGAATLTGHVEDDHGVWFPYWAVRAGDEIAFIDAADTSYRRIIRVECDDSAKTARLDLDAPPEGMDALLERLGVVLVPLGVA